MVATELKPPTCRWSQIKRNKIVGFDTPKGEKTTPSKRKSGGNDDDGDDEGTPSKKAHGGRKKKVKVANGEEAPAEGAEKEDPMAGFE